MGFGYFNLFATSPIFDASNEQSYCSGYRIYSDKTVLAVLSNQQGAKTAAAGLLADRHLTLKIFFAKNLTLVISTEPELFMQRQHTNCNALSSRYPGVLLLIFFIGLPGIVKAQDFAINNERQNIFFYLEENPISVVVNNCPCSDINVTAISAEVVKISDRPCRFKIIPERVGKTILTLSRKSSNEIIGTEEYRVLPQRVCLAFAGKCGHGKVRKHIVPGVTEVEVASSSGADYHPGLRIQQFMVSVERSNSVIFKQEITGSSLSPETKTFFQGLEQGDIIRFDQIICKWPDGKIRGAIESAEFEVIE